MRHKNHPGCPCCGSGGTGSLPGCSCSTPPGTLYLSDLSTGDCVGLFNSATLVYGPTPSVFVPFIGANAYLSEETFVDGFDETYRYHIYCDGTIIHLQTAKETSIFGDPSFFDTGISWTLGNPGNTCSPFSLTASSSSISLPSGCDLELVA